MEFLRKIKENIRQKPLDKHNLEVYTKILEDYNENIHADQLDAPYREKFINKLSTSSHVLDYGCGSGNVVFDLQEKGFNIIGSDISESFLEIAKKKQKDSRSLFIKADSKDLVKQKLKFDGIISEYSLIHLDYFTTQDVLSDFNKILTDKGLLYLSLQADPEINPKNYTFPNITNIAQPYPVPYRPELMLYIQLYQKEHISEMLKKAGFLILDMDFREPIKNEFPFKKILITAQKIKNIL